MYPPLETERLTLRPWQLGDETRLMDFAEVLNKTVPDNEMPPIHSIADAKWIVEDNIKDDNQWAVVFKPDNLLIGWVGLAVKRRSDPAYAWVWIDKIYQNRGLYGEIFEKIIDFGFNWLKTKDIVFNLHARDFLGEPPKSPYNYKNPIRKIDTIALVKQPTEYMCGQAVIAMLAGVSAYDAAKVIGHELGTSIPDIATALKWYGFKTATKTRVKCTNETTLPQCCVLSMKIPGDLHWSLYFKGKFYDPQFGVLDRYPEEGFEINHYWEVILCGQ